MENLIKKMREDALSNGQPILREQSFKVLEDLIKKYQPKKILEVGINVGCSSGAMLLLSKDAILHGIELNEDLIEKAKENYKKLGVYDRVKIFPGDAGKVIPTLKEQGERYDFVFIDGPKSHYLEYFLILKDMIESGGVILCDNVLFRGMILTNEEPPKKYRTIVRNLRAFIEELKNNSDFKTEIVDIEDGLTISVKVD